MRSQLSSQTSSSLTSFIKNCARVTDSKHVVYDPTTTWGDSVKTRLYELVSLDKNWDGYNACSVSFGNAAFALNILNSICDANAKPPSIVPGVSGDLQLEWHTLQGDLELHVIAPNHVNACYSILGEHPEEGELELALEFSEVARILGMISEAQIAAVEPAA